MITYLRISLAEHIDKALLDCWTNLGPDGRAAYVDRRGVVPQHNSVKTEPLSSTSKNGTPALAAGSAVEEPPLTSAELEEQKQKTFQLEALLKDASPKMLEDSVEQGVKLLNKMKAPLESKMANSPDAEQWLQQIGK